MHLRGVKSVFQNRHKGLVDQGGFPAAAHPADSDEATEREVRIDAFEVVSARSLDTQELARPFSPDCRDFDCPLSFQVIYGHRLSENPSGFVPKAPVWLASDSWDG